MRLLLLCSASFADVTAISQLLRQCCGCWGLLWSLRRGNFVGRRSSRPSCSVGPPSGVSAVAVGVLLWAGLAGLLRVGQQLRGASCEELACEDWGVGSVVAMPVAAVVSRSVALSSVSSSGMEARPGCRCASPPLASAALGLAWHLLWLASWLCPLYVDHIVSWSRGGSWCLKLETKDPARGCFLKQ